MAPGPDLRLPDGSDGPMPECREDVLAQQVAVQVQGPWSQVRALLHPRGRVLPEWHLAHIGVEPVPGQDLGFLADQPGLCITLTDERPRSRPVGARFSSSYRKHAAGPGSASAARSAPASTTEPNCWSSSPRPITPSTTSCSITQSGSSTPRPATPGSAATSPPKSMRGRSSPTTPILTAHPTHPCAPPTPTAPGDRPGPPRRAGRGGGPWPPGIPVRAKDRSLPPIPSGRPRPRPPRALRQRTPHRALPRALHARAARLTGPDNKRRRALVCGSISMPSSQLSHPANTRRALPE